MQQVSSRRAIGPRDGSKRRSRGRGKTVGGRSPGGSRRPRRGRDGHVRQVAAPSMGERPRSRRWAARGPTFMTCTWRSARMTTYPQPSVWSTASTRSPGGPPGTVVPSGTTAGSVLSRWSNSHLRIRRVGALHKTMRPRSRAQRPTGEGAGRGPPSFRSRAARFFSPSRVDHRSCTAEGGAWRNGPACASHGCPRARPGGPGPILLRNGVGRDPERHVAAVLYGVDRLRTRKRRMVTAPDRLLSSGSRSILSRPWEE